MNDLLIYKNPYIFDRLMELGVDYTDALSMYQVGFLGYTGSGINRIDPGVFRISKSSNKNTGTTAKRTFRVSPEKDMLILFPGYLLHSVETNLNPMFIRRSVGMNFWVVTERW